MKKFFAVLLVVVMLFTMTVTGFAGFASPVDGIKMVTGLNPVVRYIDNNKFEYIIYARDMKNMTNGDFSIFYAENLTLLSFEETGGYDMCFYNDADNCIKISYLYNESNQEASLKMFVLTFSFTGNASYPDLKVTNMAGTYIKKVADVVVVNEDDYNNEAEKNPVSAVKGDVDLNGKVTAADARLALRKSAKLEDLSSDQFRNADVNGDSMVSSTDARLILRYAAGLSTVL